MLRRLVVLLITALLFVPTAFAAENRTGSARLAPQDARWNQNTTAGDTVLKGKTIVIDPGHGGSDTGAIGKTGLLEKDVTLAIGSQVRELLAAKQATVIMTRDSDRDVSTSQASDAQELQARVNIAKQNAADILVSIHIDSFSDPAAQGTSTYFYAKSPRDVLLASQVQQALVSQIGLTDRGTRERAFYVLKYTTMPAILTEVAFISNPQEETMLQRADFIQKTALGIVTGLTRYFELIK